MEKNEPYGEFPHHFLKKTLLIMRFASILLILGILQVRATDAYSQKTKLSLDFSSTELIKILDKIEDETEFFFLYNEKFLDTDRKVSITVDNQSIDSVLDELFSDTDIKYTFFDQKIILAPDYLINDFKEVGIVQQQMVTGQVIDSQTREPMPGVNVIIKDTYTGTTTDADGNFSLSVNERNAILVFSYIGYVPQEVPLEDRTTLVVSLVSDVTSLDEVMVIGYGTVKKADLTGSVTQVSTSKLQSEKPTDVQSILRGNAVGLNVGFSAAAKGGGSLEIRGRKSLTAGGQPLYVVDGVIYFGELSDINPADIESIDILKDASSAAVFGAKAANGVIAITTKKGKTGKPAINIISSIGFAELSKDQPIYGADEFLIWRGDAMRSTHANNPPAMYTDPRTLPQGITVEEWLAYDGSTGDPVDIWLDRLNLYNVEKENYRAGKSINWYNKVFHKGMQQDYTISISNRTNNLTYYWSFGYQDLEGVVIGDRFSTIRSRLNLESDITKFLTVGINTQFSFRDESQVPYDWPQMAKCSPWGSEFNNDGTLRFSPQDDPVVDPPVSINPSYNAAYTDLVQNYYSLNSSLFAKVTFPLGITYQMNFTPRYEWYNYLYHLSSEHLFSKPVGGRAMRTNSLVFNWQIDNLLKWNRTFNGIHTIDITLLANAEKYQSWWDKMSNTNFSPNDQLGYHFMDGGINPQISSNDEYSTGDALMARVNYTFKNKYLTSLSIRRDGYSAFGQRNPRATFPAAAIAWVFTEEDFINIGWLSRGKLRLTYGSNGNRDIGRYAAISKLSSGNYLNVTPDGTVLTLTTLELSTMSNVDLKWERTNSFNVGLDFQFLKGRLETSLDFYKMSTRDLLVQRSLPTITGYEYVMANLGQVDNKGFEISVNSRNLQRPNLNWTTSFNFSLNRNEIVHLYGEMDDILDDNGNVIGTKERDDITNQWFIGHAIDEIWDFKIIGIWQENERTEAAQYGVGPGDYKLDDVNDDGVLTNLDKQFLGFAQPKFRWTMRNEFTFFNDLTLAFSLYSYWGQKSIFREPRGNVGGATFYYERNSTYVLPYWTPENPINDYPRIASATGGATFFDYTTNSFIRLENIALSYVIPYRLLEKVKIQNMRVFLNVKNAWFFAPDKRFVWDPENNGPTPRIYNLGLNFTL